MRESSGSIENKNMPKEIRQDKERGNKGCYVQSFSFGHFMMTFHLQYGILYCIMYNILI